MFCNNKPIIEIPWHVLSNLEQLDELVEISKTRPVAIFKHSTRCGISRAVLKLFEKNYNLTEKEMNLNFLDLLQYREVSNEVASRFGVQHESPQLLIIINGEVVHVSSHHAIEAGHSNKIVSEFFGGGKS